MSRLSFSPFALVHTVDPCEVGDDAGEFPVLNEVEIDPGGNAWVATAGLTVRLPSAVGVWVGVPGC